MNSYNQHSGNPWILAREFAFESVRLKEYPHLPSRFSSAFVFDNLDHANHYKTNFTSWNSLYEVEFVTPDAPTHRAAFNLVEFPPPELEFVPVVMAVARQYWQGADIEVAELITKSALRVKALVSSGPAGYQP